MTGCIGSEDIDITILSAHSQRANMFKWRKEGSVEILDRFEVTMSFFLWYFLHFMDSENGETVKKTIK